jgi:ribonuclease I
MEDRNPKRKEGQTGTRKKRNGWVVEGRWPWTQAGEIPLVIRLDKNFMTKILVL